MSTDDKIDTDTPSTSRNENEGTGKGHLQNDDVTSRTSKASSHSTSHKRSISSRRGRRLRALVLQAQWRKQLQDQRSSHTSTNHSKDSSSIIENRGKSNLRRLVKAIRLGKENHNSCRSHNAGDKQINSSNEEKTRNDSISTRESIIGRDNAQNGKLRANNLITFSPGNHCLSTEESQKTDGGTNSYSSVDSSTRLDIKVITMWFSDSLMEPTDIEINFYIMGYEELHKMSKVLGPIFKLVGSEIRSKLNRMIELQNRDTNRHYFSMMSMVAYEIGTQLISTPGFESGCRTFLRLNRGLEFLSKFLERVAKMEPDELPGRAACEVYYETLGQHHKWFHRKSALLLLSLGLPVKESLVQKMCGNNSVEAAKDLPKMLEVINEVINRAHLHFKSHDILNLS